MVDSSIPYNISSLVKTNSLLRVVIAYKKTNYEFNVTMSDRHFNLQTSNAKDIVKRLIAVMTRAGRRQFKAIPDLADDKGYLKGQLVEGFKIVSAMSFTATIITPEETVLHISSQLVEKEYTGPEKDLR